MAEWKDVSIFKKNILTTVKSGELYIPTITGSSNWDRDNLVFLTGMNELDMLNAGRSVIKEENKISDLRYSVKYKKISPVSGGRITYNNDPFSSTYTFSNCYYVDIFINFKAYIRGSVAFYFDLYEDGSMKERLSHVLYNQNTSSSQYTDTLKLLRIYLPDLGSHNYTFKNLSISGTTGDKTIRVTTVEKFIPGTTSAEDLQTNIIIGENLTLVK